MAKSVTSIYQGQDYQARLFWLQACRLFQLHSKVVRVGYELDGVKSFDDVSVVYSEPICDVRGDYYQTDYYQVKFHVDHAGAFTYQNLMDPAFIGATSTSLLKRLRDAQAKFAPDGTGARFHVVAPWPVHPDDVLGKLVSNQDGELRLNLLSEGGARSEMGRLRSAWSQHLGIQEADLYRVLRPLRIHAGAPTLMDLGDSLSDNLRLAGLKAIPAGALVNVYDDLIRKLAVAGKTQFTKNDLIEICAREGLWVGPVVTDMGAVQLGIRSFMRWADTMQDQTDRMLCLVRYFDNRNILDPSLWSAAVYPELESFLLEVTRTRRSYHLRLAAHNSIAFAAGYCLDPKSGVDVATVQATACGSAVWKPDVACLAASLDSLGFSGWLSDQVSLGAGNDLALAISITHDISGDVERYVRTYGIAGSLITCNIACGPSATSIRDGTHAILLAQDLIRLIRQHRTAEQRRRTTHVFASAPNAFMFFLGQRARNLGHCVIYEYDFDGDQANDYQQALVFPPVAVPLPP